MFEVVDAGEEVAGKLLQGEVPRGLDFALCAVLEIAVVGDGAEVLVLLLNRSATSCSR